VRHSLRRGFIQRIRDGFKRNNLWFFYVVRSVNLSYITMFYFHFVFRVQFICGNSDFLKAQFGFEYRLFPHLKITALFPIELVLFQSKNRLIMNNLHLTRKTYFLKATLMQGVKLTLMHWPRTPWNIWNIMK
jgi:hypothetical protein